MTERQSSGLVKKGKFVRALMEMMGDGKARNLAAIWTDGNGNIGPTQDYVQVNLDKLVASGEVKIASGVYSLPDGSEWLGTAAAFFEPEEAAPVDTSAYVASPVVEASKPIKIGERDLKFETFIGVCFMQEIPTWEVAADFYARLHGVTYSVVKYDGKMGGERLKFNF